MKTLSILSLFFLLFFSNASAAIQLTWSHTNQQLFDSNGSDLLKGGGFTQDSSVGHYIQLILGTPVAPDVSEVDAVAVGNTLLEGRFIGSGVFEINNDGKFSRTNTYSISNGDKVFVRFWNAASPNYASNFAPITSNGGTLGAGTLATHYADSAVYTINDGGTSIDNFNVPGVVTNIPIPIPEPTTFAVITVAGMVLFGLRRRFRG